MAYDEKLEQRLSALLIHFERVTAKKMFGGVAFLLEGKMFVGITKEELMVRLSEDEASKLLEKPHVRPMDFTGRPMKGYIYVAPEGIKTKKQLQSYVDKSMAFVDSLPAKKPKKSNRK